MGDPSTSRVDGESWQVDILSDCVPGNTQSLGNASEGNALKFGVVDRFPQGLFEWCRLSGWRSISGGMVLIIHQLVDGRSQSGQALELRP